MARCVLRMRIEEMAFMMYVVSDLGQPETGCLQLGDWEKG
jgi:hypothetical protein